MKNGGIALALFVAGCGLENGISSIVDGVSATGEARAAADDTGVSEEGGDRRHGPGHDDTGGMEGCEDSGLAAS